MPKYSFPHKEVKSAIFGSVKGPLIHLKVWSRVQRRWLDLYDVLADTGADISLFPREVGEMILEKPKSGKLMEVQGVSPYARLQPHIHILTMAIGDMVFKAPVAIADASSVPPILGRVKGLDLFNASFQKGRRLILAR